MSAFSSKAAFSLTLAFSLSVYGVLGDINCEQLDRNTCAFAVSSSGSRCVLEKRVQGGGREEYSCRNSGVQAIGVAGYVEDDFCVTACSLDRDTFGISSDSLHNKQFVHWLCSSECYDNCPNIVDLYSNVAAGEGVYLKELCGVKNDRREMAEKNDDDDGSATPDIVTEKLGSSAEPPAAAGMQKMMDFAEPPTASRRREMWSFMEKGPWAFGRKLLGFEYGRNVVNGRMLASGEDEPQPEMSPENAPEMAPEPEKEWAPAASPA